MITGSVTDTGISYLKSERTQCLRRGELLPRSISWMDAPNPIKPRDSSSRDLDLRLIRQLRTYSFQDPRTSRQKPVPIGLVVASTRNAGSSPKDRCLADLVQIGFYFCLRSCEYTKTNSHRHTTQFCLRDMQFQDNRGTIPLMPLTLVFFKR